MTTVEDGASRLLGNGGNPPVVFELLGADASGTAPELLGLWIVRPDVEADAVSFAACRGTPCGCPGRPGTRRAAVGDGSPLHEAPVWRVDLRGDAATAAALLAAAEARLARLPETLCAAEGRLRALAAAQAGAPPFDSAPMATLAPPEADLLRELWALRDPGAASFAFPGTEGLGERVQTFLDRLLLLVSRYAWVETRVEGQLLGRTAIRWGGDVETIWRAPVDPTWAALHQQSLSVAVTTRREALRMLALAVRGAALLSMVVAAPGGALLALPAVWRFIQQVYDEGCGVER